MTIFIIKKLSKFSYIYDKIQGQFRSKVIKETRVRLRKKQMTAKFLSYGRELWALTGRCQNRMKKAEMKFLTQVDGCIILECKSNANRSK
jgi:hypothetical protein